MIVVKLLEAGVKRVLNGQAGMTFIVDRFTATVDDRGIVAHIRDYRYTKAMIDKSEFSIWSLSFDQYEVIE